MKVLSVLNENDNKILHSISVNITRIEEVQDLIVKMKNKIEKEDSLGISAIQLGEAKNLFVMKSPYNNLDITVCLNPYIKKTYKNKERLFMETCLSTGEDKILTRRSTLLKVGYTDENGNKIKRTLSGIEAVIFQHEMDHLNGKTIIDIKESV